MEEHNFFPLMSEIVLTVLWTFLWALSLSVHIYILGDGVGIVKWGFANGRSHWVYILHTRCDTLYKLCSCDTIWFFFISRTATLLLHSWTYFLFHILFSQWMFKCLSNLKGELCVPYPKWIVARAQVLRLCLLILVISAKVQFRSMAKLPLLSIFTCYV